MIYRCVVGNCGQPDEQVKRCYWSPEVGLSRGTLENHAYLDLCWFHQEMMASHHVGSYITGWDAIKEESCDWPF